MAPRWVTFLSDYGLDDHLVGVCKGVMARIAPEIRIIDVCHQVRVQHVEIGASMLAEALPYLPVGVHLALVDPYRPTPARPIVVRTTDGSVFVSPDNGLCSLAWTVAGGVAEAREVTNRELCHPTPAKSFRGRDLFAPIAAHLAAGTSLADCGEEIDPAGLVRVDVPAASVHGDHVHGSVRMVDHFGNLALNVRRADLEAAGVQLGDLVELRCSGKSMQVPFTVAFGEVPAGRTVLFEDGFRAVTLAVNSGRADRTLRVGAGDPIVLSRIHRRAERPAGGKVSVVDSPPSTFHG